MWDRPGAPGEAHSGGQHQEPSSLPVHVPLPVLCSWHAGAFKLPVAGFVSGIDVSSVQQPVSLFLLPLWWSLVQETSWLQLRLSWSEGCSSLQTPALLRPSCFRVYLLMGAESLCKTLPAPPLPGAEELEALPALCGAAPARGYAPRVTLLMVPVPTAGQEGCRLDGVGFRGHYKDGQLF